MLEARSRILQLKTSGQSRMANRRVLWIVPREGAADKGGLSEEQIMKIIEREGRGSAKLAIKIVARERKAAADRARLAEDRIDKLVQAGVCTADGAPIPGAVLVQGDDAKHWPAIKAYVAEATIDLPKLLELVKKVPDLEATVAKNALRATRATAAKDLGWNGDALDEVLEAKGLEIEERDMRLERDGKKVTEKVWCVRKAGDSKGEWSALDEYAETNLKVFLPSLQETEDGEEEDGTGTTRQREGTAGAGTRWPEGQTRGKKPPEGKVRTDEELRKGMVDSGTFAAL